MPIGALVVVVFRLILGIRVLGRFRAILVAFGFLATGTALVIILGTLFAAVGAGPAPNPRDRSRADVGSGARAARNLSRRARNNRQNR